MGGKPFSPDTTGRIEFRNETEDDFNVVVCESRAGQVFVHLLGDTEEIHGDEATTVPAEYYAHAEINRGKR